MNDTTPHSVSDLRSTRVSRRGFVCTTDAKLTELGKRFTKLTGVNVRIDHIQSVKMSAKLASELVSKSGHDIVSLEMQDLTQEDDP